MIKPRILAILRFVPMNVLPFRKSPGTAGRVVLTALFALFLTHLDAAEFEAPPLLKAADLLEPVWLKSEIHSVEPKVTTETMMNHFVVQSKEFGEFEVYGTALLKVRVRELHAIAALKKRRAVGPAVAGVVDEGASSVKTIAGGLKRPVRTLFQIPKGLASIGKRSASSAEGKIKAGGQYSGGPVRDWFQVSEKKQKIADKFGVDPYTDNEKLRKHLNRVGGISATTGIGVRLIVPFDGLVAAAEAGDEAEKLNPVYLTPPTELYRENLEMLKELGVEKERAVAFLGSEIISPADQSLMVRSMHAIEGVKGAGAVLDAAGKLVANRPDSMFFRRKLELLRAHQESGSKIRELRAFRFQPVGITETKRLVVPSNADQIYWSEPVATVLSELKQLQRECGCDGIDLILAGRMTDTARNEVKTAGVTFLKP